jgi:hypothetical protein
MVQVLPPSADFTTKIPVLGIMLPTWKPAGLYLKLKGRKVE